MGILSQGNQMSDKKFNSQKILSISISIIAIIALIALITYFNETLKGLGPLGDFFGGILNPIISGAALVLLYKTFVLQKTELEETRKLVQEQSEETKRQSKITERQLIALYAQSAIEVNKSKISALALEMEQQMSIINFYTSQINEWKARNGMTKIKNPLHSFDKNDSESIISIDGTQITPVTALELIKIAEDKRSHALEKICEINKQVEEAITDIMPK